MQAAERARGNRAPGRHDVLTTGATGGAIAEKGYTGKMLNVNLSTGEITIERPDESR